MASARTIELGYRPLDAHIPFHASTAETRCQIGGLGSGKSLAMCWEILRLLLQQPGTDGVLMRKLTTDLTDSTEAIMLSVIPPALLDACEVKKLGGHVNKITFPNGSILKLRGLEDYTKYKSQEFGLVAIDEADEVAENEAIGMRSRLRQRTLLGGNRLAPGQQIRRCMILSSNPAGKNWLWSAFVDPKSKTHWPDSSCHLSTALDNPYLPVDYVDWLLGRPERYVRRFVFCQFDEAAGRVYEEWSYDTHAALEPRAPGKYGSLLWMGMDPGILNPTAGLWVELDRASGRMVAVREYQETGRSAPDHVQAWRAIEAKMRPMTVSRRIADPSINKRDPATNNQLGDVYRRLGFRFDLGPVRDDVRIPALANLVATGQFVCTTDCPQLHDQIMAARWEDQAIKLRDFGEYREKMRKGGMDHIHDCAQYLASKHVARAAVLEPAPRPADAELTEAQVYAAYQRERMAATRSEWARPAGRALADGVVA